MTQSKNKVLLAYYQLKVQFEEIFKEIENLSEVEKSFSINQRLLAQKEAYKNVCQTIDLNHEREEYLIKIDLLSCEVPDLSLTFNCYCFEQAFSLFKKFKNKDNYDFLFLYYVLKFHALYILQEIENMQEFTIEELKE